VDGRWWVSRRDSRWLGPVGQHCSAGGLGVPLTLLLLSLPIILLNHVVIISGENSQNFAISGPVAQPTYHRIFLFLTQGSMFSSFIPFPSIFGATCDIS